MSDKKKIAAVILAAGSGTRMGLGVTKQRLAIKGKSLLKRSVEAFCASELIDSVTVVARADELDFVAGELDGVHEKYRGAVVGGQTRAESAANGFYAVSDSCDVVAVHDAARCLVTPEMIDLVAAAAIESGAATAATPVTDTVKRADGQGFVTETVPRASLWSAQTPQMVAVDIYRRGLALAKDAAVEITDDNMIAEMAGARVRLVDTGRENIKITLADDVGYAEYLLSKRENGREELV